ncbi:MAG: aspartate kinase [Armatimonadetes bacterium]|nr:aspartate kinase [Armatimonadota bacterium]
MRIKVMKFGGTSVATPELRLLAARKVVIAKERGFSPVVVVSAIGRKGAPYATDTLLSMLADVDPLVPPEPREMDLMLCCGEIMSTCVFAQTLKSLGHPASAMTGGQAGLVTDSTFGKARILEVLPDDILKVLNRGRIPVVCGFQGRSKASEDAVYGEITTLGRGGSDTTACALGAALGAEAVEIYTNVDGVKTADPAFVPEAPTLRSMTYDEVAEIAHQGGKVLHPRAAEIAMKFSIPLWVKCTQTEEQGTQVEGRGERPGRDVTAITHTGKMVYLQFDAPFGADRPQIEAKVFQLMAENDLNLFLLNVRREGFAFALPRKQLSLLKEILDGLVIPIEDEKGRVVTQVVHASADGGETESPSPAWRGRAGDGAGNPASGPRTYMLQIGLAGSSEVRAQERMLKGAERFGEIRKCVAALTENCMVVSIVAHAGLSSPGVYLRVMECLHRGSIQVIQTSDSRWSISLLVTEADAPRAVRLLHGEFGLAGVTSG